MSIAKKLFLEIEERIKEKVPEVKYIDLNMGQFEQGIRPGVMFPAVLIEFDDILAETNHSWRRDRVSIKIWVVCENYSQSQQSAPIAVRQKAMEYLDVTEHVVDALHLWQSSVTNKMVYLSQRGQSIPEYRMRQLEFQTSWVKSE